MTQFQALGLSKRVLQAIAATGYDAPTPIQRDAIPAILKGHDIMGLAQTGTGKTAAFGLPLIDNLLANPQRPFPKSCRALILAPTRELANQITTHLRGFVRNTPLKIATVVGGMSINVQMRDIGRGRDIIVATPGRLLDLMERRAVILAQTNFLVLDEADQMLDLGFIHSLRKIAKALPKERQTLLFSATMPPSIQGLAQTYLTDPVHVEVARSGMAADKVLQSVHFIGQRAKADLLKKLLGERPGDLSLVFSRTKHGAEKLMKHLVASGYAAASIHGNKSQGQRDRAIREFRDRKVNVLVATDVAARGIDIPGVSHVYNYDLPQVAESYVHRIGRTARAGAGGQAVAFCSPEETKMLRDIERLTTIELTVASGDHPGFAKGERRQRKPHRGQGPRPEGNGRPRNGEDGAANNGTGRPHRGKRTGGQGAAPAKAGQRSNWRRNRKRTAA